ncbi:MAG: YaeQ family protein [Elusimicrobia bacterium]|nr:YaeQ family protein [Elusimicrobiota bacterium]MDE2236926.1 YaeQ family protein [Elusimicrobiota bacterium]MDE2427049.1 YaeQ family protein [Elusimicrobiota bacterium]
MKLRCDLHVNGGSRKLLIAQGPSEPPEHLALKLSAYLLCWDLDPIVDASAKTPALSRYEFLPDILALDEAGDIRLWLECGSATLHKLDKLTRRLPQARIVVLKAAAREAERLRGDLRERLDRCERVEIVAWPGAAFKSWLSAVGERTEVYGEASELSLNAVVNEIPFAVDFSRY